MAPIGEKTVKENEVDDAALTRNIWVDILRDVQKTSSVDFPASKHVLVLGDKDSGKTTLFNKLQSFEEQLHGPGLEYMYLNVKDEYKEDKTRLNVWLLEGDLQHRPLLRHVMTEKTVANTLVVLTASLAQPWSVIDSLNEWSEVLETYINRLRLAPEDLQEYRESLVRHFQDYAEPDTSKTSAGNSWRQAGNNPLHPPSKPDDGKDGLPPLDESILSRNLGVPIVVVITKSDLISVLEKEYSYREEHLDFIQHHVRQFCLAHGAALIYTSAKENTNCDLLQRYIMHRIYGLPFNIPASPVEKEAVFIPTGWDNDKKMAILQESFTNFRIGQPFKEVVVPLVIRKLVQREPDTTVDEEQGFFSKLQATASKQPAATSGSAAAAAAAATASLSSRENQSPLRSAVAPSPRQSLPGSGGIAMSPPQPLTAASKKIDPKGGPTSESVLSSFFNSLLTKKQGTGPPGKDMLGVDGLGNDGTQAESTDQPQQPPAATAN